MKIGVIGTGSVSKAISGKLAELAHEVTVGARSADSESLEAFAGIDGITTGSFADAAAAGELLFSVVAGDHTIEALEMAGEDALAGKTVIDTSNRLDTSREFALRSTASVDNSTAIQIQERFPEAHIVKSLNTMTNSVMIDPSTVPGDHVVFVSGEDAGAKDQTKLILAEFGWRDAQIVDLGGIASAAAPEMLMPLWMNLVIARGGFDAGPFNFAVNSA
jgi:8-hydroxy-5-deazaflavin:NADPH oxidoreductase